MPKMVAAMTATAGKLRAAAGNGAATSRRSDARRLADALAAVVKAGPPPAPAPREAFVPGLKTMLRQVSDSLKAAARDRRHHAGRDASRNGSPPTAPPASRSSPKDTSNDPAALSAFSDQVLSVAPDATGAPISIRESGRTIVGAFIEAGMLSFIVIMHPAGAGAAQRRMTC